MRGKKKKSRRGERSSVGKNNLTEENVIPKGPWKHLQKYTLARLLRVLRVQINEWRKSCINILYINGMNYLNVMIDIMNCGPWLFDWQPLSLLTVNIFRLSQVVKKKKKKSATFKSNFIFHDMCFLLSGRILCSLLPISSTMSPSRAGCRTGWAAGWPEPTSCTAAPAGNTSRSWPTRGSTPTETTERCTVRQIKTAGKKVHEWSIP